MKLMGLNFSGRWLFQEGAWIPRPGISGKSILMTQLRTDCLPEKQVILFNLLRTRDWLKDYYLAGGTGLALQMGHRESVDFDFFSDKDINTDKLAVLLNETGVFKRTYEASFKRNRSY